MREREIPKLQSVLFVSPKLKNFLILFKSVVSQFTSSLIKRVKLVACEHSSRRLPASRVFFFQVSNR